MKNSLRKMSTGAAILLLAFGLDPRGTASPASAKSHNSFRQFHVQAKLKHSVDNAPNYTDYYWTDLYFYEDGCFYDGEDWGDWYYDGNEIHADVSDDFEDDLDWQNPGADDVDGWFKYTDIVVDGDQIKGKMKGRAEIEWDFWFWSPDYDDKMKGKIWGYEVDDNDGHGDWDWWPW